MFFIFFLGGRGCYIKNPSHLIRTLWANAMPTVLRKRASQLPSPWEQHFHCGHPVLQTQNIIAIFLYVNGASQSSRIEKPRRNENFMFRTERNCVPFPSDVNRCPGAPLWAFFFLLYVAVRTFDHPNTQPPNTKWMSNKSRAVTPI